ncbi:hypothetical protein EN851_11655 [Mesorhizobium sp. M8A.F.Ca.ET.208.01.1.1]|nr:MAG: hypothetical protein EOS71_05405 [Mesorhizobium sp.]TGQ93152.1 hypothetical protein EN851_11655 [Mesorhizobium sp. M8A.F.Ca.ET.208.01.1.1]TGT53052.1 hypothetical protein EN810_11645 [Mesorhizobium sp. M8A.F.Ca.ET.167.01.1.1]
MLSNVSVAPHLPAGILSPYSDGERALSHWLRQSPTSQEVSRHCCQLLLPVPIPGEVPGRAMRGGATV